MGFPFCRISLRVLVGRTCREVEARRRAYTNLLDTKRRPFDNYYSRYQRLFRQVRPSLYHANSRPDADSLNEGSRRARRDERSRWEAYFSRDRVSQCCVDHTHRGRLAKQTSYCCYRIILFMSFWVVSCGKRRFEPTARLIHPNNTQTITRCREIPRGSF